MTIKEVPDSQLLYSYPNAVERYGDIKNQGEWRVSKRGKEPLLQQRTIGVYGREETTWRLIPKRFSRDEVMEFIRLSGEWGVPIRAFAGAKFILSVLELRDAIQLKLCVLRKRLSYIYDNSAHSGSPELIMLGARAKYLDEVIKALDRYIAGVE